MEKCPKTEEDSNINVEGEEKSEDTGAVAGTGDLEPGELASDTSRSSSEDETATERPENRLGSEEQVEEPEPSLAPVPLLTTESLLEYCRSQLSLKPGPRPPPPLEKPVIEFTPISPPDTELNGRSQSRYQPYRSPLAAFRSYRCVCLDNFLGLDILAGSSCRHIFPVLSLREIIFVDLQLLNICIRLNLN